MALVVREIVPVLEVLGKIDFLCCPEASHLLFVHLPDVVVLDWQNHKSVRIFFQERLSKLLGLRILSFVWLRLPYLIDGNLLLQAAMLTVVLVHELGAQMVDYVGWLFECACLLLWMALRELFNLLLLGVMLLLSL